MTENDCNKYFNILKQENCCEIETLNKLSINDFKLMGFKIGHAAKLQANLKKLIESK